MKLIHRTTGLLLLGTALVGSAYFPAFAASSKTAAPVSPAPAVASAPVSTPTGPDPKTNPGLQLIMRSGAKLYYLGNQGGLDGWLILKDGQIQFVYAAPDGKHVLLGGLFGPNGEDETAAQADGVMAANPEVREAMNNVTRQTLDSAKATLAGDMQKAKTDQFLAPTVPAVSISPGERIYQDMFAAKGVAVGKNLSAPLLFMVIDPDCPHCQATWRMLRDFVFNSALQIRLIPIGNENSDSERAAAQLLRVSNPLEAWNKYVDGDKSQLAGNADPKLVADVQSNHLMIDDWDLQSTPIIVYRGKDGKVKIEQGEPDKVAAIVGDIDVAAGH